MLTVKTGGLDVIGSESFISIGLGETLITLGQANEALSFSLNFVSGEDGKQIVKFDPADERSMSITFFNWDSSLAGTLLEPAQVGTFSGRKLYLMFSVAKIGSKGDLRQITFTAYLGDEVKNGQD